MNSAFTPGPTPNTVRAADGAILTAPDGWVLLPPGDAALTRRVKETGDHWVVQERRGRKIFSRGEALQCVECRTMAFRVLQPGGFLQLAITHPCFDLPLRGWMRDGAGRKIAYQCGDYFSNIQGRVEEWLFSPTPAEVRQGLPPFKTPKFFRPPSAWPNALVDAGCSLERMDEPCASEDTVRRSPNFAGCRLVPLWLMMRCRKSVHGGKGCGP
jgi:hypothetical protein